jgi:hypothetical protein
MKHFMTLMALVCIISTTALAGDIPSVGITSTRPDGGQPTTTTAPGEIPTSGSSYEITEATLNLIQMFLGVGV